MACILWVSSVQGAHHDAHGCIEVGVSGPFSCRSTRTWLNVLGRRDAGGCRLHCANYRRAPRGGPDDLPEEYRCRFSFCCDRDGCRKRMTPPSVRFLGRKVYLGAVVILISAMRQGPTPRRVRELSTLFGADRATIARWQAFWRDHIPQPRSGRSRIAPHTSGRRRRFCPCRSWTHSSAPKIPARTGGISCDFCRR